MDKFNAPIDQWNTSEVTNMKGMFLRASSFNQPITMDTSKVTDMSHMFSGASKFNQPLTIDTSQVTDMRSMFRNAKSFNQPITMDTSQVTTMENMFRDATSFDSPIKFTKIRELLAKDYPYAFLHMEEMFKGAACCPYGYDGSWSSDSMRDMLAKMVKKQNTKKSPKKQNTENPFYRSLS